MLVRRSSGLGLLGLLIFFGASGTSKTLRRRIYIYIYIYIIQTQRFAIALHPQGQLVQARFPGRSVTRFDAVDCIN